MAEQAPGSLRGEGFYVVAECCLMCGVPEAIAPGLFGWSERSCHVKRQPASDEEIFQMLDAVSSSEADCIRYAGSNPAVLRRLGEAALAGHADDPTVTRFAPVVRDRVKFAMAGDDGSLTPALIASQFRTDQRALGRTVRRAFFAPATVRLAWYRRYFHTVRFGETPMPGTWVAHMESQVMPGLNRLVYDWFRARGASNIRWLAQLDDIGAMGQLTPL